MLKALYDFRCAYCAFEMEFTPSFAMQSGTNMGHGKCGQCGKLLMLGISDDGEKGFSKPWPDDMKEEREALEK